MKIYQVTQVVVLRVSSNPLTLSIQASGLAATSGWTKPVLDNSKDPKPADAVHEFSFEAERPTGPVAEVLTPISAAIEFKPAKAGADAVIVSSRTNSITVHASEFIDMAQQQQRDIPLPGRYTTLAIGEERPPITTFVYGEEGPRPPIFTSRPRMEEMGPWTYRLGEGPWPPITSPATDDPRPPLDDFLEDPEWDPWGPMRGVFGQYRQR